MAKKLIEETKVFLSVTPQTITNSNVTGRYFPMARCTNLMAICSGGAAAISTTVVVQLYEATSVAGGGASAITLGVATATANTKVKGVTLTLTTAGTGDTLTINGTVWTQAAGGAAGTWANAAALIILLNAVPGFIATAAAEVVTLYAIDGYYVTAVGGNVGGTVVVATIASETIVEITQENLTSSLYTHVCGKVTTTATGIYDLVFVAKMKELPTSKSNYASSYPA